MWSATITKLTRIWIWSLVLAKTARLAPNPLRAGGLSDIRVSDRMKQVINEPLLEERSGSRIEATLVGNVSPLCCWVAGEGCSTQWFGKAFDCDTVSVSWDVLVLFWVSFLFHSDLLMCCLTVVLTRITSFLLVLFLDAPLPVYLPLSVALIWFRCLAGSGASRLSSWTFCLSVGVAVFAALICLLCALSHR